MNEIADSDGRSCFAVTVPVKSDWSSRLARITLAGPEGYVEMTRDSGRSVALLLDQDTGAVRGILRDWPDSDASAVSERQSLPKPDMEMIISRGIPSPSDW